MTIERAAGARFATWWVASLTRTAERHAGRDRRAEVAADVHEQLVEAAGRGDLAAGSRSVMSRVLRGAPADIAWRVGMELSPSRVWWHLRNPSTSITALFGVMFPITMVADSTGRRSSRLVDYRIPLWVLTDVVGCCLLVIAGLALAMRLRGRQAVRADRYVPASRLESLRRAATAALGIAWAGAATFRYGVVAPVGSAFWVAFGAILLGYLALLMAGICTKVWTVGRYLPKVST